jgi:hypothetical protein
MAKYSFIPLSYSSYREATRRREGECVLRIRSVGFYSADLGWPSANVVAMGKHLMFWEQHTDFNAVLDRFLARLE